MATHNFPKPLVKLKKGDKIDGAENIMVDECKPYEVPDGFRRGRFIPLNKNKK